MNGYEFKKMYQDTCALWWEIWKQAAKIDDVNERNAFLDSKCEEYMNGTDYFSEAFLMERLTEIAKDMLELYQNPMGFDDDGRIQKVS